MAADWEIVQATGKRIDLERGLESRSIQLPTDPQKRQLFIDLRPGQTIDEATLAYLLRSAGE